MTVCHLTEAIKAVYSSLVKYLAVLFALLLVMKVSPVVAAKPENPGGSGDFTPIPNSVCIDPGHGGSETGAINQDLRESDVNLTVANLLKVTLIAAGYDPDLIFLTRTTDISKSNADRYNYCNDERAAVLISIHHNGSTDPNVDFTTALYAKKTDVPLANLVATTVSVNLGLTNHGVSRFASGVLLKSKMPATISEGFFLTNAKEYEWIKSGTRLSDEAEALFLAVNAFLKS